MKVVIPLALLKQHHVCDAVYSSPEWDTKEQALVYPDWDKTVERHLATPEGIAALEWHVFHGHVPMTPQELFFAKEEAKKAKRARNE